MSENKKPNLDDTFTGKTRSKVRGVAGQHRDKMAAVFTGGSTALVEWVLHDYLGIPIPHTAAGLIGAVLGILLARWLDD